jgi:hypothetical protein
MFIIPTSVNNKFNMLIAFGLYWKSNLQINQYENMTTLNFNFFVIFYWTFFNQNYKYIQINIENDISIKTFYQSWQIYIIFTHIMFMKLVRFNKFIPNIKFINI